MNRKKRPSPFALSLPLVTAALLITCGAKTPGPQAEHPAGPQAAPPAQSQPRPGLTEDERNTIDIVKRTKNSVVFVTNIQLVRDSFFLTEEAVPRGSGSGFVWDGEGHIVTNAHVIEEGDIFKAIDGTKVRSYDDLYNTLDNFKIGDRVTLTVERERKERQVPITLVRID